MKTVSEIIESGRCYACGMCSVRCPENAISLKPNMKSGFYEVHLNDDACVGCGLCLSSCPASADSKVKSDTLGEHKSIYLCRSTDESVRKGATSGGAVNAVIRFLIESKTADSVLAVKENSDSPFESEAVVINRENCSLLTEEPRSFASRYVSIPVLNALKQCTGKTAVVGTPCQIKALGLYGKDIIKIAIACSGATSYNASKIIKERLADSSFRVFYRGNGWPGYNTLTDGKKVIEAPHGKSYFERMYTSQLFRSRACRNCPSHFGEESDLTFFDFWNSEEIKNERLGNSVCTVRTETGSVIFNGAVNGGYLETVRELVEDEAVKTQGVALKYKSLRPYNGIYFKLIDFLFKTGLYRLIPLKGYKYFCRLLAKTVK